jgi:hypothetical protein
MGSLHQPAHPLTAAVCGHTIKGHSRCQHRLVEYTLCTSKQMLAVRPKFSGYLTLQMSLKVIDCSVVPCGVVRRHVGLISGCVFVFHTGSLDVQSCLSFQVLKESVVCVEVRLTGSPSATSVANIIV